MSYQVLALKWRPRSFEEIVGQEAVIRTLQNAITGDRIAHAFLFSGVRGVGKTTTARILAKAMNCQSGITITPCGECSSCLEIAETNSLDVLEIDAASNTGVDNIRELRESVRYGTARDRFKIFIIDEVHMLSNAAFNALLKTLEEPPPHVKFILATTESHKIPVTITSRCQHFEFKPIPFSLIKERLALVCREEGIQISSYALNAIAGSAEGSLRDAESSLDQIVAFSGQQVKDEDVPVLLGIVDDRVVLSLLGAVLEGDRKGLIEQVQELDHAGVDPHNLCRKLIRHIRNLMVCKISGWDEQLLHLADSDKEEILEQAGGISQLDLIRFYDLLNRTENELRWNSHPFFHLELALVKLVELGRLPELEEVITRLGSGGVPDRKSSGTPSGGGGVPGGRKAAEAGERKGEVRSRSRPGPSPAKKRVPEGKAQAREEGASGSDLVGRLLDAVQKESVPLYSCLQHAHEIKLEKGKLFIRFQGADAFHHRLVSSPENHELLSRLYATISGSTAGVEVVLSPQEAPAEAEPGPAEDPRVKVFVEAFPGKVEVIPEDQTDE